MFVTRTSAERVAIFALSSLRSGKTPSGSEQNFGMV
jgi:hypothetical protein